MMNVVGRVGNLITQGVLAIAVPFHPFGGAIDVIVVQQRDGTFRSTPWHVQFGKFQGVLKGAEKVRITVNGVEADFHMYLDSSGEAYFTREVDSSKGSDGNMNDSILDDRTNGDCKNNGNQDVLDSCIQEHGTDDSGVQMQDEPSTLYSERNEMAESGGERIFCFQDEQSPLDDLVEISDDRSNQCTNIEIVKSHNEKSEVISGSVDGHAPTYFLASKKVTEKMQLNPLQNQHALGNRMDFSEGNEKFDYGDDPRPCNCNNLNASKSDVDLYNICSANNDTDDIEYQLEVCEGDDEHVFHSKNQVDITGGGNMDWVSNSCMELAERGQFNSENVTLSLAADTSEAKGNENPPRVETVKERAVAFINNELSQLSGCDSLSTCSSPDLPVTGIPAEKLTNSKNMDQTDPSFYFDSDHIQLKIDHEGGELERSVLKNEYERELPKSCSSKERTDGAQPMKFEISLCGSKLCSGMGLSAAAEAFDAHRVSAQEFGSSATSIIRNENLVIRSRGRYWHWDKVAPVVLGMAAFGMDLPVDTKDSIPVEQDDSTRPENEEAENISTPSGNRWRLWSTPFRRVKKNELNGDDTSNEEVFLDTESEFPSPTLTSQCDIDTPRKQISRTYIPTTEQIASLNLKEGQNRIKFTFPTKVLGVQKVDAHIYLWKWNARIVISDVDGTITKSDVLGQFMPLVGMDWTQSGVARLFSAIKDNGYQLLFLSARAIVQAYLTRSFLLNLKQDGEALPDGPVVISPDGLFPSLYREVIRRTPHEFKIACLEEIRRLFPSDHNPFYAGFGNRDTDELSYMKMGIPKGKIFIINPKGEVMNSYSNNAKSYTSLLALVNEIFPPALSVEQEDFNEWNYWKMPLPEVD
ncbi:phosphatidate phosphatase PAH1-like [Benincasa hispida]|uniref:phosphatidate phosphatase PAH1-like n=1 Tax=Benincasa hispida TaxID=102211 RepID=UPI0018FFCA05|nr:phosphatidate phosphatase PAH1-like [Benincasa hispida]XP_038882941.1 phosphatidate phosphatase PAH1-like [Benincasa hispida]